MSQQPPGSLLMRWRAFLTGLWSSPGFGVVSMAVGFIFVPESVDNPFVRLLFGGLSGLMSVAVMLILSFLVPGVMSYGEDERILVFTLPTLFVAIQFVLQMLVVGSPFWILSQLGPDPGAGWSRGAPWAVLWAGCLGWMAMIRLLSRARRAEAEPS